MPELRGHRAAEQPVANGVPVMNHAEDFGLVQRPSTWTQSWALKRTHKCQAKELVARLGISILAGLFIAAKYGTIGNDASKAMRNIGLHYTAIFFTMFAALLPTAMNFPLEMPVFLRKYRNNRYSLNAYFLAKIMAGIPFQVINSIIFGVIVYYMTELPFEFNHILLLFVFHILVGLAAQAHGLLIGAVFTSQAVAVMVALCSGMLVSISGHPGKCYARYGFEGVIQSTYGMNRTALACPDKVCEFQQPKDVLQALGLEDDVYKAFIAFFGVWLVLYVVLYCKIKRCW